MHRVTRSALVALTLLAPSFAAADPPAIKRLAIVDTNAKIINVSAATQVFHKGETLEFNVLRAAAGTCSEVKTTIEGKSRVDKNVTFPWALKVTPAEPLYPKTNAKYDVVVEGMGTCSGQAKFVFAFNTSTKGEITNLAVSGFNDNPSVTIMGHGQCRVRLATYNAPYDRVKSTPIQMDFYDKPFQLPATFPLKRSGEVAAQWGGTYVMEIYVMGVNALGVPDETSKKTQPSYEGCSITAAGAQNILLLQRTYNTVKSPKPSQANNGGNTGGGGAPAGGGGSLPAPKPANGKIVSMLVPGGSFAEDETQKFQVNGQGGCGMDLTISNKTYGGSYEQTFLVMPMKLDGGATLYNGTHFGTLAEGSWKASTAGKSGCTGNATIDFKVTAKTSTKHIAGQPTISFDQQPKGGGNLFVKSKDSSIWFKVQVPQAVKDEQYATCCDVEFDYLNEYGGWEPLPNSPFSDSSWGLAVSQQAGVVPKSVSGFTQGTQWRMKVRAMKFKTQFDWSDWLEFKVDQN